MLKTIMFMTISAWFCWTDALAANEPSAKEQQPNQQHSYNQALAEQLGADEYGMKMYVMAFLKQGPNRNQSPEEAAKLQQAHLANIRRMAASGELVLAGPFEKNESGIQGIYIFNVTSTEAAEQLTQSDPAIQAGRLEMELIPWYGSAALMQVNEIALTLAKKSF